MPARRISRSNPFSDSIARPWDFYTAADRDRIKAEAAASVLEDLDGDRTDPAWLRYCERHGINPAEVAR